jgi:zinc/manganese transport system substrate-binding protein
MSRRLSGALGLLVALPLGLSLPLASLSLPLASLSLPLATGHPGVRHQGALSSGSRRRATLAGAVSRVVAVGAESQYANVIAQIGGRYVKVSAIMRNPATDPHSFEASPSVAKTVASARLVVQNGLGYDTFMQTIEDAAPNPARRVIVVQELLHKPSTTRNPHLWYSPRAMPAVAEAVAKDLSALEPAHRQVFRRNLVRFDRSLRPWLHAISTLRTRFKGTPVATTEPVADYLLQAAGLKNATPFRFQADVMNGIDPSPQAVALVEHLLVDKKVKALVYNRQVTDTLTGTLLADARRAHVPVVGVYETMPPRDQYQRWMMATVDALEMALGRGRSATAR